MAAAAMPDLVVDDIDLGFLDGLDFDLGSFDDLGEFCLGDAVGDHVDDHKEGGLGLCLSDSDDSDDESSDHSGREGSPDSVVTDDGAAPLPSSGPGDLDGGDSMSAYVSELERFLMEDDDEEEAGGRETTTTEGEHAAADEHKYFFGHLLAEDDCCNRLAAGAGAEEEDEEEDDVAAAREDVATSRKRASTRSIHPLGQRRCAGAAAAMPSEAELGAKTRAHPDRTRVSPPPPAAASAWPCARQQRMALGLTDGAADCSNSTEIALATCFAYYLDQVFKSGGTYVRRSGVRRNAYTAPDASPRCRLRVLPSPPYPFPFFPSLFSRTPS